MVFVTKVEWSGGGGGGDAPEEMVTLVYGAVEISYAPQGTTGTFGKPIIADWIQITNTPTLNVP